MQTYELYIEDSRYSAPTLVFVMAATDRRATEVLLQSPGHADVDTRKGGALLFTVKAGRRQAQVFGDVIAARLSPSR